MALSGKAVECCMGEQGVELGICLWVELPASEGVGGV
jgi:hypothetical protein